MNPPNEWPAHHRNRYLHVTKATKGTDIRVLSGNSKQRSQQQAAADLHRRQHGHWDRIATALWIYLASVKASLVLTDCCSGCFSLKISAILFPRSPMKSVVEGNEFNRYWGRSWRTASRLGPALECKQFCNFLGTHMT
jgi:hypothetical protein